MLATFAVEVGAAWQVNKRISTSCRFAIRFWGKSFSFRLPRYPFKVIFSVTFSQSVFDSLFFLASGRLLKINFENFRNCFSNCSCEAYSDPFYTQPRNEMNKFPSLVPVRPCLPLPLPPCALTICLAAPADSRSTGQLAGQDADCSWGANHEPNCLTAPRAERTLELTAFPCTSHGVKVSA